MPAWLLWTLTALLSWGVWAVLSKAMGSALTAEQSQALSTLGLLPILPVLASQCRGSLRHASRRGLALAFAGGIITCLGNVAFYAALARGEKVATIASITSVSPLVTVLLALFLLKERLNRVQLGGLALSGVAIWLFNVPGGTGWLSSMLVHALPPILLWGVSGFLQKLATQHLPGESAALVYLGAFVPVGIGYALVNPWPSEVAPRIWLLAATLGFFIAFGNLAVLAAYARGGLASVIAPMSNLYPVISVPAAVLWFGEKPGTRESIAIATALIAVGALSRESKPTAPPASS